MLAMSLAVESTFVYILLTDHTFPQLGRALAMISYISAIYQLCDCKQVTWRLWIFISSFPKGNVKIGLNKIMSLWSNWSTGSVQDVFVIFNVYTSLGRRAEGENALCSNKLDPLRKLVHQCCSVPNFCLSTIKFFPDILLIILILHPPHLSTYN